MGNLVKFCCVAMRVVVASGEISLRTVFSPGIYSVILWQFFFFLFGTRGELFFYDSIPGEKVLFVEKIFLRVKSRG